MGAVTDERKLAALEEHLLSCDWCIDRAENTEGYIETMHAALKQIQPQRKIET